jgi:CelD/BcsL family acetyltransferase involved in cellulose biosynthesis
VKKNGGYRVDVETFDQMSSYWRGAGTHLTWDCLFVLPAWLKVWWNHFGNGAVPHICVVRRKDDIIGIAPLQIHGEEARFIGNSDVCDYQDVIVQKGEERDFFLTLIRHLRQQGATRLDLYPMREDSKVLTSMTGVARSLGCGVSFEPADISWEMELPGDWEAFLGRLRGKQRHEVRRKLRRLEKAAPFSYRSIEDADALGEAMTTFFDLFQKNRQDKAKFMTPRLKSFFQSMAEVMAEAGILRLFFLDIENTPAAAVMCFDYGGKRYLYNNGYDSRFKTLSVGVLSKVLNIRDGIEKGLKVYDFLKGAEKYKHHLGGKPVQLHRCRLEIG